MPINQRELMAALAQLAENRNIKVAVTSSLKGAALVGATSFIGGLLLGPIGLAIGGAAGGVTAAVSSKNKFRSVAQVILEDMSASQQALLFQRAANVLKDFAITDLALLLPLLTSNARLQEALLGTVVNFIQSEMNLRLTN